ARPPGLPRASARAATVGSCTRSQSRRSCAPLPLRSRVGRPEQAVAFERLPEEILLFHPRVASVAPALPGTVSDEVFDGEVMLLLIARQHLPQQFLDSRRLFLGAVQHPLPQALGSRP